MSNLPPPGPEYPETRRTGARIIQHPNGVGMYALVARDSHGNPMVMSHDIDPIDLTVMSVQMGYGQAINLGTTVPTSPGERELWSAAVESFDAVMREHHLRQASLHDEPEAQLAAQLRDATLDALTPELKADALRTQVGNRDLAKLEKNIADIEARAEQTRAVLDGMNVHENYRKMAQSGLDADAEQLIELHARRTEIRNQLGLDDDGPEASKGVDPPSPKPSGFDEGAQADMPDESLTPDIDANDLSAVDQARLEIGHVPEPPQAEASAELSDAEWLTQHQAKLDEMRASYGFTAEQYTATMEAEQARKEARANLAPTPPPSRSPGEMSEAKKAAEISMRTFPEASAAADREPRITKAARVKKQPKLGKVLKRGGRR